MKTKKRITLKFKLLILLGCLIYAGVLYVNQSTLLTGLDKEKAALQEQYDQQALVNSELQNEAQFTNSDAYVEKTAREKLGWVKKDEIKFVEAEGSGDKNAAASNAPAAADDNKALADNDTKNTQTDPDDKKNE